MDFHLSTYYNAFDVEKETSYDTSRVDSKLETITNALAHSTETIVHNHELLEELIDMMHGFPQLEGNHRKQLVYLVTSSFSNACQQAKLVLESNDFADSVENLRAELERYGYLVFVLLNFLGKEDFPASSGNARSKQTSVSWKTNCTHVEDTLEAVTACMKVPLSKLFVTTPERVQYLEMFIRPTFHLMEHIDRMKVLSIKTLMFRNIALAVTKHSLSTVVQNSVMQCLTYYIHLPAYMAELLHVLDKQYDHIALTEDILHEISSLQFNSNDSNGPKSISEFLIKLSELSPRLILKQMSSTAQLLDNSNQSLRCSVVETCGNIVVDILKHESETADSDDLLDNSVSQVDGLLNLLEERFLDQNPFVRTKAIQAMVKVCSLPVRVSRRRYSVMLITVRSLGDKSTLVRRNAIKLMYKLLLSHPFSAAHGTQLDYTTWKQRLAGAEEELQKYLPKSPVKHRKSAQSNEDDMELDPIQEKENEEDVLSDDEIDHEELNRSMMEQEGQLPDPAVLVKAKLTLQYYEDAVQFIEALEEGTKITSNLLFSKNRNEVLEAMDFLVLADAYSLRNASDGIRRMLHLVWMKGSSDEGKSISSHLIECYKQLFLTAPENATASQASTFFAKNLISLTASASLADLASLEVLLGMMYEAKLINPDIIRVLWQIYGKAGAGGSELSDEVIHGAIQILGMLSVADTKIVQFGIDSLLRIGLGEVGKEDLVLCKYTCATLSKIIPAEMKITETNRFAQEEDAIKGLEEILLLYTNKSEWYGVAEQAINAIFKVSSSPIDVCSRCINCKSIQVFQRADSSESQVVSLSQLVFIVGHVALKTLEYLENLEAQFKKQKHSLEAKKSADDDENANELEMIGGTSEDDFTDAILHIKERELLYDDKSLLARFGPMVREICINRDDYDDDFLQRTAVLSLAKLMCVSSKFCEDNLPLLITIMEKSPDPIIRCNCVLGLGDMAVCFNNLVDENTDFLYRRLTDENIMVQKTCLMTVTFLILAGQVKVKGQLSSMAKCLENPDQGISDMCRLFFTELATKDNAIYNGFIDIFSGLSNDETLSKDSMKRIVKFLVGFIEKEKHQKQLSEKLLVRLSKAQSEAQWQDIAFVLNTMPYKNDSITSALETEFKKVSARQ